MNSVNVQRSYSQEQARGKIAQLRNLNFKLIGVKRQDRKVAMNELRVNDPIYDPKAKKKKVEKKPDDEEIIPDPEEEEEYLNAVNFL